MPANTSSSSSTIVSIIIIVGILSAALSGLLVRDFLMVDTVSAAKEEQSEAGDWYANQAQQAQADHQKQMREAELEALRAHSQQELDFAAWRFQLEQEQSRERAWTVNLLLRAAGAVALLAVGVTGVGLAFYLVCIGRSQVIMAQGTSQVDWRDEHQHAEAVRRAREAERQWRAARQPAVG